VINPDRTTVDLYGNGFRGCPVRGEGAEAAQVSAGRGVEGVAAVHRADAIPHHKVTDSPVMAVDEFGRRGVRAEPSEQLIALGGRQFEDHGADHLVKYRARRPWSGLVTTSGCTEQWQ
jgi:hypothetical protein